jgi:hypothetical protein
VKTTVKYTARFLPLLLILFLESGCTYALWTNGNLEAYREPAQNPDLHVFQSEQRNDFLVVYKEQSERNDAIHTRAYWLNEGEARIERQDAPHFVFKKQVRGLEPIPVYYATIGGMNTKPGLYAICDTNQTSFALFSNTHEIGSYRFPVYNDHWGTVEKTTLTPLAMTADTSVACGYFLCKWAQGGDTIQVGK